MMGLKEATIRVKKIKNKKTGGKGKEIKKKDDG